MEQSSVPPQIDLRSQSEPEPISSNPSSSSPPPPSCINNLDVLDSHEENSYHQDSMTRMVAFRDSCSSPTHAQQEARRAGHSIKEGDKVSVRVCLLLWKARAFI